MSIPVIDVFAGPGGLGEGFSSLKDTDSNSVFDIALSIEMDEMARETLLLRTFFRQFKEEEVPEAYYKFIRQEGYVGIEKLRELLEQDGDKTILDKFKKAEWIAKKEELGKIDEKKLDGWIRKALQDENGNPHDNWVLVGGPPCQAYSVVGRSRRGGISSNDPRVYLYREYYRILAKHNPPVFVMENVKGLLSAHVEDSPVFEEILRDVRDPVKAYSKLNGQGEEFLECPGYDIYSLVKEPREGNEELFEKDQPLFKHSDFVIKSEEYGIPQARHRLILLGVRKSKKNVKPKILEKQRDVFIEEIIKGMPFIRSGLSKRKDSANNWKNEILKLRDTIKIDNVTENYSPFPKNDFLFRKSKKRWMKNAFKIKTYFVLDSIKKLHPDVANRMSEVLNKLKDHPIQSRGSEFVESECTINSNEKELNDWYLDERVGGFCNHTARGHMGSDLHRYLFVSAFGEVLDRSPKLEDFPRELLPNHVNAFDGVKNSKFADRFRVQLWGEQAKTITSHISKDGHYYIHPDPVQCRSLTVREAARIQTFPDNYFFCGPRTSQYIQVGNAVPPLLAKKIATTVADVIKRGTVSEPIDN